MVLMILTDGRNHNILFLLTEANSSYFTTKLHSTAIKNENNCTDIIIKLMAENVKTGRTRLLCEETTQAVIKINCFLWLRKFDIQGFPLLAK